MFTPFSNSRLVAVACSLTLLLAPASLKATIHTHSHTSTLTGSGINLPLPAPNQPWPPGVASTLTPVSGGFTGTWTSPAHSDWIGTFSATGPIPNNTSSGTTNYDFSTLLNGELPAGTFFIFGDVDITPSERFDLTAFDGSGNVITSPWLDDTFAVTGTGTGTAGAIVANNMPGWDWDISTSDTYRIDGSTVTGGNPSIAFALVSNQPIVSMRLFKASTSNSFALRAPFLVPEPSTALLAVLGIPVLVSRSCRMRRLKSDR